jgi:rifampin ADP-ribosylating transferase
MAVKDTSNPASPSTPTGNTPRRFYHGTRARLKPGDLLQPGYSSNYTERRSPWIYFSETLHAATWGAELAKGEGPGRIYVVEPTGAFVDDPNVTDKKYPGNPTKSYRSREPLRVVSEHLDWQGHSPEQIQAMKDFIQGQGAHRRLSRWRDGAELLPQLIPSPDQIPTGACKLIPND